MPGQYSEPYNATEMRDALLAKQLQEMAARQQQHPNNPTSTPPIDPGEIMRALNEHLEAVNFLQNRVRLLADRLVPVLLEHPTEKGDGVGADWAASSPFGIGIKQLTYGVRTASERIERLLQDLAL